MTDHVRLNVSGFDVCIRVLTVGMLALSSHAAAFPIYKDAPENYNLALKVNNLLHEAIELVRSKRPRTDAFPMPSRYFVKCIDLIKPASTTLCLFNYRVFMNAALDRASFYVEQEKRVQSHAEHLEKVKSSNSAGHDLSADPMKDYLTAYGIAKGAFSFPQESLAESMVALEEKFWAEEVVPRLALRPGLILIAGAVDTDLEPVLSHELQHAQYRTEWNFRQTVHKFWRDDLTTADKDTIKKSLSKGYNTSNEELVIDETQAYLLMRGSQSSLLAHFVPRLSAVLESRLGEVGLVSLGAGIEGR